MRKDLRPCRRGFTLIELLVVIAIIAILAAILFPVFARAQQRAKQIAGISNVKQLALGLLMYTQDYDGRYPIVDHTSDTWWWDTLNFYVGNREVFRAPIYGTGDSAWPTDYILNGLFVHGTNINRISQPSRQITIVVRDQDMMVPGYHPWPGAGGDWDDIDTYLAPDGHNWFKDHIAHEVHFGGSNYGFADGHAEWLLWEDTVAGEMPGMHNVDRKYPPDH